MQPPPLPPTLPPVKAKFSQRQTLIREKTILTVRNDDKDEDTSPSHKKVTQRHHDAPNDTLEDLHETKITIHTANEASATYGGNNFHHKSEMLDEKI